MLLRFFRNGGFHALPCALCTNVLPMGIHFMGNTRAHLIAMIKMPKCHYFRLMRFMVQPLCLGFITCSDISCG